MRITWCTQSICVTQLIPIRQIMNFSLRATFRLLLAHPPTSYLYTANDTLLPGSVGHSWWSVDWKQPEGWRLYCPSRASIHTLDKHFCDRNTHTHTHISEMLKVILKYELACLLSSVFSAGSLVVRKNLRTWKVAREGETESVVLHFQPKTLSVACLASEFVNFVRWSHD